MLLYKVFIGPWGENQTATFQRPRPGRPVGFPSFTVTFFVVVCLIEWKEQVAAAFLMSSIKLQKKCRLHYKCPKYVLKVLKRQKKF